MIVYFILILFICFVSIFDLVKIDLFTKKLIFITSIAILVIFAGTRYETGNDWREYTRVFERIPKINELWGNWYILASFRMEAGYLLLNSITKTYGGTVSIVFFISCFFTVILLFSTFKRYAIFPLISILLYMRYGYMQFNTMFVRQGLAVSLFFCSLKYITDKNFIKYFLLNLLGVTFHSSIIVVFPLYFFLNNRFSSQTLVIGVLISIILSFFRFPVPEMIIPGFIQNSIENYLNSDVWGDMHGKLNIAIIEKIMIFGICIYFREKLEQKYEYFNLFLNLFVISIIAYYVLFQMYIFQQRITVIFQLSSIFIIPYFLSLFHIENHIRYAVYSFLVLGVMFFFIRYIISDEEILIPYKSWLIM